MLIELKNRDGKLTTIQIEKIRTISIDVKNKNINMPALLSVFVDTDYGLLSEVHYDIEEAEKRYAYFVKIWQNYLSGQLVPEFQDI